MLISQALFTYWRNILTSAGILPADVFLQKCRIFCDSFVSTCAVNLVVICSTTNPLYCSFLILVVHSHNAFWHYWASLSIFITHCHFIQHSYKPVYLYAIFCLSFNLFCFILVIVILLLYILHCFANKTCTGKGEIA